MEKGKRIRYCGTLHLGPELMEQVSKEEFACLAFYLAAQLRDNDERQFLIEEFKTLQDNGIIRKRNLKFCVD